MFEVTFRFNPQILTSLPQLNLNLNLALSMFLSLTVILNLNSTEAVQVKATALNMKSGLEAWQSHNLLFGSILVSVLVPWNTKVSNFRVNVSVLFAWASVFVIKIASLRCTLCKGECAEGKESKAIKDFQARNLVIEGFYDTNSCSCRNLNLDLCESSQ